MHWTQTTSVFTDSGPAATEAALRFAHENVFDQPGDRPTVKNILILDTDEIATDDPVTPARALREDGVLVRS